MTIHEGHRQRLYEKLLGDNNLSEHEYLEALLFNAYPRINTNPIAHALIDAFGSLKGVLEADYENLLAVKGVGERVAGYIRCVGIVALKAYALEWESVRLRNYGDFKTFTADRLRGRTSETLEIYMCDKSGKVVRIFSYTENDMHSVHVKRGEISTLIATEKPYGILVGHNHITGDSRPSSADDEFTAEVQMICSVTGVILYDHCIYSSDNDIYSYFADGKIDKIRQRYNMDAIIGENKK